MPTSPLNVDRWRRMPPDEFTEIGSRDEERGFPLVNVITIPERGFAILSTSGVYVDGHGDRVIETLAEVREVLKSLGIKLCTIKGKVEQIDADV